MVFQSDAATTSTGFRICPKEGGGGGGSPSPPAPSPPSAPAPPPSATPAPATPTAAPPPSTDAQKWVNRHNYWRCIHGSPPIAWDVDFARSAQEWADKGVFKHADSYGLKPPEGPAGENIAAGSAGYMSIKKAVDMWHDENPERGPKCGGHCTAMLWKAASKLGCGINPQTSNGMFLVCRYGGGNPVPNMGGHYEANVGFPDMSKEPECRRLHLEGGGGANPAPQPPPPATPRPAPQPPAPQPPAPRPPSGGAPSPPDFQALKDQLKDLKAEIKDTEDEIAKAQGNTR
mmetsp:Transcript_57281/g.170421  ORF Transcript_57281/g.170421 Transcript_57281/m.170421 type:complete len:288 (+) Transcript_57281:364-1227(+)